MYVCMPSIRIIKSFPPDKRSRPSFAVCNPTATTAADGVVTTTNCLLFRFARPDLSTPQLVPVHVELRPTWYLVDERIVYPRLPLGVALHTAITRVEGGEEKARLRPRGPVGHEGARARCPPAPAFACFCSDPLGKC